MKIRNGFVSNSSSSSFIVALPSTPESAKEMEALLFPKNIGGEIEHPYCDETYPTSVVAKTVFGDLGDAINRAEMVSQIDSGWFEGRPELPDTWEMPLEDRLTVWDNDSLLSRQAASALALKFLISNQGCVFHVWSYADGDGPYFSTLEHGGIFNALPHIRVSHH